LLGRTGQDAAEDEGESTQSKRSQDTERADHEPESLVQLGASDAAIGRCERCKQSGEEADRAEQQGTYLPLLRKAIRAWLRLRRD